MTATALIADDHEIVRAGLRQALDRIGGISVVAEAADGLAAIRLAKQHKPSLLLLDIAMPRSNGTEVIEEVRRWSPGSRIVVLTGLTSRGLLSRIAAAATEGLLLKRASMAELIEAIPRILAGERRVSVELAGLLATADGAAALTSREMQILGMIASGSTNARIAEVLGISPKTVDNHRTHLMRKLNVHSVAELMAYALREGLLEPARQI